MAQRRWSVEENQFLGDLYREGKSLAYLGERFQAKPNAIKQRLHRLKVRRPPALQPRGRPPRRPREEPRDRDIASRLAVLLGQEPRPEALRREFTDSQLLGFVGRGTPPEALEALKERAWPWIEGLNRTAPGGTVGGLAQYIVDSPPLAPDEAVLERLAGLDAYCRGVIALELMSHQLAEAYCCLASKRALILAGRQSGKDFCISALALWEALTAPDSRIVVCSGSQRQSDAVMSKILGFVARSRETFDSVLSSSREEVHFTNGSFIKGLPSSGMIRGETATKVYVNEARDILSEDETYSALEPMLLTTGGGFAIFTTPLGKAGKVWEAYCSPLWMKVQVPSSASKYATREHLERQKLELSAQMFMNEYQAEFLDIQSSFFSPESIARCAREYDLTDIREPDKTYALGLDWARTRDTSAMVVVSRDREGNLKVVWVKGFFNVDMPTQIAYAKHLHNVFHFQKIVSEYAGLGIGPTDQLLKDLGGLVEAFKPTTENKALGYDNLKVHMERSMLTVPMHPKLLSELRTLQFRLTPAGSMTIHHPGGGSDDYADALMFATWPFRTGTKAGWVPVVSTRPGISSGPAPGAFEAIMEELGTASERRGGPGFLSERAADRIMARQGDPRAAAIIAARTTCYGLIDARTGTHCRLPPGHLGEHEA